MSEQITAAESALDFRHGDNDLLLYFYNRDGQLKWLNGHEDFVTAHFTDATIEFVAQDENNTPLQVPDNPEMVFTRRYSKALGQTAFLRWIALPGDSEWTFQANSAPRIGELERFRTELTSPYGAHDLPLTVANGEGQDELFTHIQMAEAFADGVLLISSTARHYLHDTRDHGFGIMSLEAETMQIFRKLCVLGLKRDDPFESKSMLANIIGAYDMATFYYKKDGCKQVNAQKFDPLMSLVMKYMYMYRSHYRGDVLGTTLRTIEKGPFTYNPDARSVSRYDRITKYYAQIKELDED